jgi:hypothetical protein
MLTTHTIPANPAIAQRTTTFLLEPQIYTNPLQERALTKAV